MIPITTEQVATSEHEAARAWVHRCRENALPLGKAQDPIPSGRLHKAFLAEGGTLVRGLMIREFLVYRDGEFWRIVHSASGYLLRVIQRRPPTKDQTSNPRFRRTRTHLEVWGYFRTRAEAVKFLKGRPDPLPGLPFGGRNEHGYVIPPTAEQVSRLEDFSLGLRVATKPVYRRL